MSSDRQVLSKPQPEQTPAQQAETALIQLLKDMDRWVDSLPIQRAGSSRLTQNAMPYIAALRASHVPVEAAQQVISEWEAVKDHRYRGDGSGQDRIEDLIQAGDALSAALRAAVSGEGTEERPDDEPDSADLDPLRSWR